MASILFLIPTLLVGGAEHVLVDTANDMAERGHDVTVQTIFDTGIFRERLSERVKYKPGIRLRGGKLGSFLSNRILCLCSPKLLYKMFIRENYDIEIAYLEGLPTKIIAGGTKTGLRRIAWVHIDLWNYYRNEYVFGSAQKNKKCYEKYDKIVCVSNAAGEGFNKRFPGLEDKVCVCYNPIDRDGILEKANQKSGFEMRETDEFRIVTVGRLVEQKGYDLLLDAFAKAYKSFNKKVTLYIVGDGSEKENLERRVHQLKLEEKVVFCGEQENPYAIMKQADMFVSSSRAEGFSLVIAEALLNKLPVVATKCSGPGELLEYGKYGYLTEINSESIKQAILDMVNDETIYLHYKNASGMWADLYNPQKIYDHIEKTILER